MNADRNETHYEISAYNAAGDELWISGEDDASPDSIAVASIFDVVRVLATMPRTAALVFDDGPSVTHRISEVVVAHRLILRSRRGVAMKTQIIEIIEY